MEPGQHQMMGYDRAITMFSPDGRLLQVEYAKRTVGLGNTAVGITTKNGVILVTDKRVVNKLVVPTAIEKIFKIDKHIIATASGILSDARVLFERSQTKAQQNKVQYDTPIDTLTIVKDICNLKQMCTQSGGLRPFGVSTLIAGKDQTGIKLYETDPTGLYYQYKAKVIGEGEAEGEKMLLEKHDENMSFDDALKLAIEVLKKTTGEKFNTDRIDAAMLTNDKDAIQKIAKEKIEELAK